eukprot:gene4263-4513_t
MAFAGFNRPTTFECRRACDLLADLHGLPTKVTAGAVEAAIRVGGLADIKTARIKAILEAVLLERGELSLEHLRAASGDHIKQQLSRFKGVGPKSIACVMMFCLDRAEFPVDTHVWEISKQLGWVPAKATREQAYQHLNAKVPDDVK